MFRKIVASFFLLVLLSGLAVAQTKSSRKATAHLAPAANASEPDAEVDRIFQMFLESRGDARARRSIHSMVARATVEVPEYGLHGTGDMYAKEPYKVMKVVNLPGSLGQSIKTTNGGKGWRQTPLSPTVDFTNAGSEWNHEEGVSGLKANYSKLALKGTTSVGGREAYVIEGTCPGDTEQTMYFDVQNGFLLRLDVDGKGKPAGAPKTTYFESYAKVSGVVVPVVIREIFDDYTFVTRYYEVKFNVYIDDTLFERPKAPKPESKDVVKTEEQK